MFSLFSVEIGTLEQSYVAAYEVVVENVVIVMLSATSYNNIINGNVHGGSITLFKHFQTSACVCMTTLYFNLY